MSAAATARVRAPRRKPAPDLQEKWPARFVAVPYGRAWLIGQGKVSGSVQYAVIDMIIEATYSLPRDPDDPAPEYGYLTAEMVAQVTGCTVGYAEQVLADGAERGLWHRIRDPRDKRRWLYKLTPENWATAKKYVAKPVLVKATADPDEDDDEDGITEGEASVNARDSEAALQIVKAPPIVTPPGKASRPIPLCDEDREVVCQNDLGAAVAVCVKRQEGGTVFLSFAAADLDYPHGSVGIGEHGASAGPCGIPTRQCGYSSGPSESNQQDTRLEKLRKELGLSFRDLYHKPFDEPFALRILAILGFTPIEQYVRRVDAEVKKGRRPKSGLWLNWASDVRTAWDDERAERERGVAQDAAYVRRGSVAAVVSLLRWLRDPTCDAQGRAEAEALLADYPPDIVADARQQV
jgi:DNA-binding MarR family transcriptional regulator